MTSDTYQAKVVLMEMGGLALYNAYGKARSGLQGKLRIPYKKAHPFCFLLATEMFNRHNLLVDSQFAIECWNARGEEYTGYDPNMFGKVDTSRLLEAPPKQDPEEAAAAGRAAGKARTEHTKLGKEAVEEAESTGDEAPEGVPALDGPAPAGEDRYSHMEWVAGTLGMTAKEINKKDVRAPSAWAANLLAWAKRDPSNEGQFWKMMATQMGKKDEMRRQEQMADKGQKLTKLIGKCKEAALIARQELDDETVKV